jgi:hypothetical protein
MMVTRIDRLARSISDLQDIVRAVRASGASLKATATPARPPASASWTCSGSSPSSRQTCIVSANLKASQRPRPPASTSAGRPRYSGWRHEADRHRQGGQDWPGVGLPCAGAHGLTLNGARDRIRLAAVGYG